jgi:hypothetical protein
MRGGSRPGAGRPKGAATRKTREIADQAASEGVTPLEFMLGIMRDEAKPFPDRMDMAKAAAPYVHPKLAAVELGGPDGTPLMPPVIQIVRDADQTQ